MIRVLCLINLLLIFLSPSVFADSLTTAFANNKLSYKLNFHNTRTSRFFGVGAGLEIIAEDQQNFWSLKIDHHSDSALRTIICPITFQGKSCLEKRASINEISVLRGTTSRNVHLCWHAAAGLSFAKLDNIKGRRQTNYTLGIPLNTGVEWIFSRISSLGLSFFYNINDEQDYRGAFLSLRFGSLRD